MISNFILFGLQIGWILIDLTEQESSLPEMVVLLLCQEW